VTELGLGVASENLVLLCRRDPLVNLLLSSLGIDHGNEGAIVEDDLNVDKKR